MSTESPLARAHALAGQASALLKSPSTASRRQAVKAYDEAADLFGVAKAGLDDDTAQTTLQLLVTQNRKQARDLERRLNAEGSSRPPFASTSSSNSLIPSPSIERTLAMAASRDPSSSSSSIPFQAPPFARRPKVPEQQVTPKVEIPSPLYSSTSSSDRAGDESFIHFGGQPDSADPFARFWGVLETMLDDITNPVAFTSVPLGNQADANVPAPKPRKASRWDKKFVPAQGQPSDSPNRFGTESFYIVSSASLQTAEILKEPAPKTPEELALENESLRASLDALSKQAQTLAVENAQLKGGVEKRDEMMKSVVLGVRREAQKAKQGHQDFIARSQLIESMHSTAAPWNPRSPAKTAEGDVGISGLKRRVRELEEELRSSRAENEKQRLSIEKYREKFDKLKVHAREKREAKMKQANETSND